MTTTRVTTTRVTTTRPTRKTRPAKTAKIRGPRLPWSTRIGVVAAGTLSVLAVPVLLLGSPPDAQPSAPAALVLDAQAAHTTLIDAAGRYRLALADVAAEQGALEQAQAARQAAAAQLTAEQQTVGVYAAAIYRMVPAERYSLTGRHTDIRPTATPGDTQESSLVRALATSAAADLVDEQIRRARAAVLAANDAAARVLAEIRAETADIDLDVVRQLAALGTAPSSTDQQADNQAALGRWQDYLGVLSAAGIEPPPAAALLARENLPAGMSPALDAAGQPVPGVAWAFADGRPITVLPAETVTAVSAAFAQLGKPYVAGQFGPDTFDCTGLTSTAWVQAGIAVPDALPGQWAAGAPVGLDRLQIGDLVFSADPRSGLQDVGLYLGNSEVLSASAATYQVGVRALTGTETAAVRVTVPATGVAAALPAGDGTADGRCGALRPVSGPVDPAWGGWSNGGVPTTALCAISAGQALRCDAAAGFSAMAAAFQAAFGSPLCLTDSYRSLGAQVGAFARKPALAAVPGTSNHGWGLAIDLCGGINGADTPQSAWMAAYAPRFGWVQPSWAASGGEKPEPWHWEFGPIS